MGSFRFDRFERYFLSVVVLVLFAGCATRQERPSRATQLLTAAAWVGDTETVKLLLAQGADVNAKDKNGATALKYAAARGHTAVVKLLKQAGAKE